MRHPLATARAAPMTAACFHIPRYNPGVERKFSPATCPRHVPIPSGNVDAEGRLEWECSLCGARGNDSRDDLTRKYGVKPRG